MFNLFVIAGGAVVLGMVLAIFITKQPTPQPIQFIPPEEDSETDGELPKELSLETLYKLAQKMCEEHNLVIKERIVNDPNEVYWIAENTDEFFFGNYTFAFRIPSAQRPYATMTDVLELKDFMKSSSSQKGFYFNAGYFTKDVYQPLEGPRVTLYNKRRIIGELKKKA